MAEEKDPLTTSLISSQEQALAWMEKMLALARPESVFGEPIEAGDYTIITASEAWAGMGFGFGLGTAGGSGASDSAKGEADVGEGGGGGGGGGVSTGRPVAAITVGPDGVRVERIVDVTKIALAFASVLVSLIAARGRVRRAGRG
jgi:uncharacterized spore protein YtfJ